MYKRVGISDIQELFNIRISHAAVMAREVLVTRRGQTTIPSEIRRKLGIKEGSRLAVEVEDHKVVFTKIPSVFDLAGTSKLSLEEAFRRLDTMREKE
jgi:AbrB family looped-hinge helix DNA binding protein